MKQLNNFHFRLFNLTLGASWSSDYRRSVMVQKSLVRIRVWPASISKTVSRKKWTGTCFESENDKTVKCEGMKSEGWLRLLYTVSNIQWAS